jgi:hypothetical protein
MRTSRLVLIVGLLFLGCGKTEQPAKVDASPTEDVAAAPDAASANDVPAVQVDVASAVDSGSEVTPSQSVDSSVGRDATKVQSVILTAVQVFMTPTAPFLFEADLTRGADGLFDFKATVMVSLSGCTGDACNRRVSMRLSREETTRVEGWLAVIPGEACHDDPGPVCDFGVRFAIGVDGPPQNQTCCKLNEWGQNMQVMSLHDYLQNLAVAQLNPVDGGAG